MQHHLMKSIFYSVPFGHLLNFLANNTNVLIVYQSVDAKIHYYFHLYKRDFLRFYPLIQVKSKNKTLESADLARCFD